MAAIEFDVTLHAEQLKKDIAEIKTRINEMASDINSETEKVDSGFSKLGATIGGAFAVGTVAAFGREMIQAATESYKAESKVAQAILQTGQAAGFTAEELSRMAKSLQESTVFDSGTIMNDVTAQLLTFTNITGENFAKAQEAVLDLATVLDGDLKGAASKIGKALNDPASALKSLTGSGIQFSEAQKKMVDNLIIQNKLFEAQSVILAEINRHYGGQARAMGQLPIGKIEQVRNAWADVKEQMGKVILESWILGTALDKLSMHGYAMNSEQLSFWEKINPFVSLEKKYEKAKVLQAEFEERQRLNNELSKAFSNAGESSISNRSMKTNSEMVHDLRTQISQLNSELDNLRASDVSANIPAIEAKEEELKTLTSQLETLTGISRKQNEEYIRNMETRAQALKNLLEKEVEMKMQAEATKVEIMKEGSAKQIAQAELAYQKEIIFIQKQKEEMLKLLADSGLKVGSPEYDKRNTEIQATTNKAEQLAAQQLASEKVRIEQEAAERIIAIRKQITEVFISDQQQELNAVTEKYSKIFDELLSQNKVGSIDWNNAVKAEQAERLNVEFNYAMRRIDAEEEVATRTAEIQSLGVKNTAKIEQQKILIFRKYAKDRLAELSKLNTKEAQAESSIINLQIEKWEKDLKELSRESAQHVVSAFHEIARAAGEIDTELGNVLTNVANLAQSALTAFSGFTTGNIVGAITGALGVVNGLFKAFDKSDDTTALEKSLQNINRNLEIQAQLLATLSGENWFLLADKQIQDYSTKVDKSLQTLQQAKIFTKGFLEDQKKEFEQLRYDFPNIWGNKSFNDYLKSIQFDDTSDWGIEQFYDAWVKGIINLTETEEEALKEAFAAMDARNKLMEDTWSKVTSTNRDAVADSIIDGFRQGYKSAEDFAGNFEDMMRNAVINALKTKILTEAGEGSLTEWYKQFFDLGKDGFTPEEIEILKQSWNSMVEIQRKIYDDANAIIGLDSDISSQTGPSGLTGSIKGITEETASMLAGHMYAIREHLASNRRFQAGEQLDIMNQSVTHLAEIASNTRHNQKLNSIDDRLKDMNAYLKAQL